jgi:NAD(P)-dependent dehydrogenase (short-subunit alcohol dehydrogenase family)
LVFITGASSGIGQALAWRYYQAGYALALLARRSAEIQSWVDAEKMDPKRCKVYGADVSDPASVHAAAQACLAAQGLPDVVIGNAGISVGMDTRQRVDIEAMSRVFATNNIGMAASFQPFVALMERRGHGVLVGIASVAGIRGLPGHGAYCASKAAVISYCESLRGELKPSGIRVVTLSPGYIDTPLTRANRYAMPFLMTPERFAEKAFQAIAAGVSYRVIPWQMGVLAKLLRVLPNRLFDTLLTGRARKHRQNSPTE